MKLTDIEYLSLRITRKYVFTKSFLSKFGNLIPYYKVASGQYAPLPIVKRYTESLAEKNFDINGSNVLELGVGVTNSTCYELAFQGAASCCAYEPYQQYDVKINNRILQMNPQYKDIAHKVSRIKELGVIGPRSMDIILSNSVFEHVDDINKLFAQLSRIMSDNGCMVHFVDYRDHFFKYPFNFYKYSEEGWKWIDPGLSRLRIGDHLEALRQHGFNAKVLRKEMNMEGLRRFKAENKISDIFLKYSDDDLATISAVIFASKQL